MPKKDPAPLPIAIYSRKSKFTGKGESIGNQVELCRDYIRTKYGGEAADTAVVFEDEGFSGGNLNRPGFQKMMAAVQQKQFSAIVVYRLDRISRNISDFSSLIQELGRLEVDFVSIREQFDTGNPMGRAMMYIASVFSQLERETIAERIRDNMHELAKTGRWLGGNTPTGYTSESVKSVTVDGKAKKSCKLKLIPEEADLVREIFRLYLETDSLTLTEAELLRRQVKTKTGKDFSRFAIKAILQNPVYLIADTAAYDYFSQREVELFSSQAEFDGTHGIMAYNRTDQINGHSTVYLPMSEWIIAVGKHPGLIPSREWIAVQDSLDRNKSKSYRKPRNNEALLTGLLYCRCGNRMYPKLSKRKNAEGKPIFTYVCKLKEHSQKALCDCKNAAGNLLDEMVIQEVKSLAEDKPGFIRQLEQSKKLYLGDREQYDQKLAGLRKERADLKKKITALVDSLAEMDGVARDHVARRIEELHHQGDTIDARIRELEGLTKEHALSDIEFDLLRQLLSVFQTSIDGMTVQEKRAAIRTVVKKVVWDGEYAHVVLFGAEENNIDWADVDGLLPIQTGDKKEEEPQLLPDSSPAMTPLCEGRK